MKPDVETMRVTAQGIPISLVPCFQEYNLDDLYLERDRILIIERVLAYGDRREVRWLLATFGVEAIKDWLSGSGARRLSRRRHNLWCTLFDVNPTSRLRAGIQPIWPH
ncbi:MAG: hypothetical protein JXA42_01440 [Anaerolineales bacterium]|nr:hypothetical protein [Anaerolineales bacterium]